MLRRSRIDAPGALHPIIVRGIERKNIFKDDTDRDNFLERLKISQSIASQFATRGEKIAKENKLKLMKNK